MRIVCFGDSNTWGLNPVDANRHQNRWTRVLASLRPEDEVIEAGLNGRTITVRDDKNPERHGMTALPIVMQTHNPIDLVILMLGTNELKSHFNYGANQIALGIGEMLKWLLNPHNWHHATPPKVLLVSPIKVHPDIMSLPEAVYKEFDERSVQQGDYLAVLMARIAAQYEVAFFDASTVANPSNIDGIHMDEANHIALAKAIAQQIEWI